MVAEPTAVPPAGGSWRDRLTSPILQKLLRGSAWVLVGAVAARGFGLVAAIVIARLLGRDDFGRLGIVQSTVAMFQTFAGFGLGLTSMKYVAEWRECDPARAGRVIALTGLVATAAGLMLAGVLVVGAGLLARGVLGHADLAPLLRIGAVLMLLAALNGAQVGALSGLEAFRSQAVIGLLSGAIALPLQLGGAWIDGVRGALWGYVAASVVTLLLNQVVLRRCCRRDGIPVDYRGCRRESSLLWRFSLPAVLADAVMAPVNWACTALLVGRPGGLAQMGIYNAANQWQTLIMFIPRYSGTVAVPLLSRLSANRLAHRQALRYSLALNCGAAIVFALPVAWAASWIMSLYGDGFREGRGVLIVVCATAVLMALGAIGKQVLVSHGRMWWRLGYSLAWSATALGLTIWLAPRFLALGLALAMLGAAFVLAVLVVAFLGRRGPEGAGVGAATDAGTGSAWGGP